MYSWELQFKAYFPAVSNRASTCHTGIKGERSLVTEESRVLNDTLKKTYLLYILDRRNVRDFGALDTSSTCTVDTLCNLAGEI